MSKWKDEDKAEFRRLIAELKDIRKPETNGQMPLATASESPPASSPPMLFDLD